MKTRCVPVLIKHYQTFNEVPELFALGFAAYLYFTKPVIKNGNEYFGELNGMQYPIKDDEAGVFYKRWKELSITELVQEILKDNNFWGTDLYSLPGFKEAVIEKLNIISNHGINTAIESIPAKKAFVA